MQVGIGLPSTIPGTDGQMVLRWAAAADEGPFSSLAIIDRVLYPNHEPLISLAAAAALTKRVRLMTTILLAPLREPVTLAKQIATLDVLSGGRVTLGVGVGRRSDDFTVTGHRYSGRGKRLEQTLDTLRRIWRGEPVGTEGGRIGPMPVQPGGPPVLIGAHTEVAMNRIGKYAEGFIHSGGPDGAKAPAEIVHKSWHAAGRPGEPSLKGMVYFALGSQAVERGKAYLQDYYSFLGPAADFIAQRLVTTPEGIEAAIEGYEEAGYDEVCFWPTAADLEQVSQLAKLVS